MKSKQTEIYFNTVPLAGGDLAHAKKSAKSLQDRVLTYFKRYPNMDFTPFQVWHNLGETHPITSIRRAITNLTDSGELVMTENKRMGIYGTLNNCWKLCHTTK